MIKEEVNDKYIINNDYNYCHDYFRQFGVNYLLNNLKKDLKDFNIVGADVVELAPDYDASGASTAVAAKVIRELLMVM